MSASGSSRGWGLVTRFTDLFPGGLKGVIVSGIGGMLAGLYVGGTNAILAGWDLLIKPLLATGEGSSNIISSFLGGIASIIGQGVNTTVQSMAPGASFDLGPLTFPLAIAVGAGAGLWIMAQVLQTTATSDALPGTYTDLPIIGTNEDDE